jgi:hypothetical protein
MIVTIDGQRVEHDFPAGLTLQDVIDQARAGGTPDRLVVGVCVDGQDCDEQRLAALLGTPVDATTQIDLQTGVPTQLAAEALRNIAEQVATVGGRQAEIAAGLRGGDVVGSVTRIGELVQAWQLVQQAIVQISTLIRRNLLEATYDGQTVRQHLDAVLVHLRELRDALDAQDMVLLADLLEYETPTVCTTWEQLLRHVGEQIEADAPATA